MLKVLAGLVSLLALALAGLWLNWQLQSPSHDRNWQPLYATLPEVEKHGQTYRISNVRNWQYGHDTPPTPGWLDVTLDPKDLVHVYFIVEPFGSMKAIAHTMLAFEFADGSGYVASVEARRELGEAFGGVKAGFLPMHEYMFVWATERDMYANSTFFTGDALYLYRLDIPDEAKRAVLTATLEETAALKTTPVFYNTFFSNCANVLARAINRLSPRALPWNKAWHLPGYAADYLHDAGMFVAPGGFEALRTRSHITPHVEELYRLEDPTEFATALRERLWVD